MSLPKVFTVGFLCTIIGAVLFYIVANFLAVSLFASLTALTIGSIVGSVAGWAVLGYYRVWPGLHPFAHSASHS